MTAARLSPFKLGEAAVSEGLPRSANPFPKPDAPAQGDDYPGPWHNWDAGWYTATATAAFEKARST